VQRTDCGQAPGKTCIVLVKRIATGDNRASGSAARRPVRPSDPTPLSRSPFVPQHRIFASIVLAGILASVSYGQDEAIVPEKPIQLWNGKDFTGLSTWVKGSGREDPKKVFSVKEGVIHVSG